MNTEYPDLYGDAPPHRVQVTAAEVVAAGVVHGVGERAAVAKLAFVPDLIDVVEFHADRLGRPVAAPGPPDELDAGVDALHVGVVVGAADRPGADVVVCQLGGGLPPGGQVQLFDQAVIVQHLLLVVSGPGSLMERAGPGGLVRRGHPGPGAVPGVDPRAAARGCR